MDIKKLTASLFASDDVEPNDELNLELFHHLFTNDNTKKLKDVRDMLSRVSTEQLENLYYEIGDTECFSEEGELYLSLGERVLFHIGERDNTYTINNHLWKNLKSKAKKKFI